MKYTLLLCLFTSFVLKASSPIEGGKAVPYTSTEYVDIIKLEDPQSYSCTGTRMSHNLVLTAAHCVVDVEGGFIHRYRKGNMVGVAGSITKVHVHPKYSSSYKNRENYREFLDSAPDIKENEKKHRDRMEILNGKTTLYDIAVLQFDKKKPQSERNYPKIISKETKFKERKTVNLVGYGDLRMKWNGESFEGQSNFTGQQMGGQNGWTTCPLPLINESLQTIEDFANDALNTLKIKSLRTHVITDGMEEVISDGTAMVLSGDSGSPSLERDANDDLVITGVASSIYKGVEDGSHATLEIRDKNGNLVDQSILQTFPDNWGHAAKSDNEFPVITEKLKSLGLNSSDVSVKRIYKRATIGNFADLSHPENQNFIKSVIEAGRSSGVSHL